MNISAPLHRAHQGLIWVYLNGKCNFTCDYCLDGRNEMPGRAAAFPDFIQKLNELQKTLGYSLIFTGGEPMIEQRLLKQLFITFPHVAKAVQTNAGLPGNARSLFPLFGPADWLSVSIHDESYATHAREAAIARTLEFAQQETIRIQVQLMCSPANIEQMLQRAAVFRQRNYRVAFRRLFHHDARLFRSHRKAIEALSSDFWTAPAFFGDAWCSPQPFEALTVHLNGDLSAVCRTEIRLGNIYSGYDLSRIAPQRNTACDQVCHCCSCLWMQQPWGFA